jgi:glucose/arabinose dehydrogenase
MRGRHAAWLATAGLAAACVSESGPVTPPEVALVVVGRGLSQPVFLTAPAGDDRLFIVERTGRIRIVQDGAVLPTPFLDIDAKVGSGESEQGLLGLAFHPNYAANGWFYVNYTDNAGDTRVERYEVSANPDVADAGSAALIIGYDQPYTNHNAGQLLFGPDGMIYIPTGDGGSGGDPQERAQNLNELLGKLLRIDVDGGDPYVIPPDNPYAGGGGRGEIWAVGLRNPWRVAFDPPANRLYIADVGQNIFEEVNVRPAGAAGLNYGWGIMEAASCYEPSTGCNQSGLVLPAVVYDHDDGCSVTGGYVYRGAAHPSLVGLYFYSDYCSGWLRSFRYSGGEATDRRTLIASRIGGVTSFGLDAAGELYVLTGGGIVFRIEALPEEAAP